MVARPSGANSNAIAILSERRKYGWSLRKGFMLQAMEFRISLCYGDKVPFVNWRSLPNSPKERRGTIGERNEDCGGVSPQEYSTDTEVSKTLLKVIFSLLQAWTCKARN